MTDHLSPASACTARESLDSWLTMWNSDGDIARQICADDFRIHFAVTEPDGSTPADDIRTSDDFAGYLHWWHEQNPGVVFTTISDAIDGVHARLLWDVRAGDVHAGGVDVFDLADDGRISRVWSVGGQRSMRIDYKSKLTLLKPDKNPKWPAPQELAKDVCGPANSRGGIVVFGIEDHKKDPSGPAAARFEPFTAADGDANDLIEDLRRDVRQHAAPLPRFDAVTVPTDDTAGFYLVLVIPPSPSAPHAVIVAPGESRKPLHYYLRQPGETSIRHLTEHEVAAKYADRARRDRTLRDDLDETWDEGANNLYDGGGGGVWLATAAVPEMPATDGRLTAQARAEISEWADNTLFPDSITGWRSWDSTSPFPRPGRLTYQEMGASWGGGAPAPRVGESYRELYADGRTYVALQLVAPHALTSDAEIKHDGLIDDLQAVARHALKWLTTRCGAWGTAAVKVGILPVGVPARNPFQTQLVDLSGNPVRRTRAIQRDRLPSSVVTIDLATTVTTSGLLAASYDISLPVLQAFGVPEPLWLTESGALVQFNLPTTFGAGRRHVEAWARDNGVTIDTTAR